MDYSIPKISVVIDKRLFSLVIVSCFITYSLSQQPSSAESSMAQKFYALNQQQLYWFSSDSYIKKANDWLDVIESSHELGMKSDKTQIDKLRAILTSKDTLDNTLKESTDKQITGLVLNFLKDLQEGNLKFDYDEIGVHRDSVYIYQLLKATHKETVSKIVSRLDCKDPDYLVLKGYLRDSITVEDTLKYNAIHLAMNYRRYLTLNQQPEYIVVNIPAAEARYYRDKLLLIKMRTVVGRKESPTPVIASYMTKIITFPYWNVPYSIAIKEILPNVQKNGGYLEQNNFDVIDAKGNVIDDSELNWADYNENNFPYFFRQSTGENNPLGVLKFDLKNPFSIFLHSTSLKSAFGRSSRFLSHGCIRLQKPIELAYALLRGKLDIEKLKDGKNVTKSNTIKLSHKVPTFIIYMPVSVDGKKVTFHQDVYGLIK